MEFIFPCSKEELGHIMKEKSNAKEKKKKVIQNLNKILGFPSKELSNILVNAKPIVLVEKTQRLG